MEEKPRIGYLSVKDENISNNSLNSFKGNSFSILREQLKDSVEDEQVKYPKELGVAHPFDMEKVEKIVKNAGIVGSLVRKLTNAIVGDFNIKLKNPNNQVLIDSFIQESNFLKHMWVWVYEGIAKGNGYMNLTDLSNNNLDVVNANTMFVQRKKNKEVIGYNKYVGSKNRITINKNTVINYLPKEIIHLKTNDFPDDAYGMGFVQPNLRTIEHFASSEIDNHEILSRKAGMPIHVKVGQPGEAVPPADVDSVKTSLEYMNNKTNWVTDANVEMLLLDFKDIGKNLTELSNHDLELLSIGMNIPMSLAGIANMPEGLANAQGRDFRSFIQSIRIRIEDLTENQLFIPYLQTQGIKDDLEYVWDMPDDESKNQRLQIIQTSLSSPLLSPELRAALEKEYAYVIGLEEVAELLISPQDARKRADEEARKREETEIPQPEVPGVKRQSEDSILIESEQEVNKEKITNENVNEEEYVPLTEEQLMSMPIQEYVNIQEIPGFNYTDFLVKILQVLKLDSFTDLQALSEQDLLEGLLPKKEIEKLRVVLNNGFKKNQSIREIEKEIKDNVILKDRKQLVDGELKLTLAKELRPNMIARTETVRLANEGLKNLYKENDIKEYAYLTALDERTCPICMSLDGQIFKLNQAQQGVNMPPMHPNCRCSSIAIL